jgi:hypothetical protein
MQKRKFFLKIYRTQSGIGIGVGIGLKTGKKFINIFDWMWNVWLAIQSVHILDVWIELKSIKKTSLELNILRLNWNVNSTVA